MDDENILNFVSITSCDPDKAAQYLHLTDGNLEQAIQLFFDSPNLDFGPATSSQPSAPSAAASAQRPINIDSDDDMDDFDPTAHTSAPSRPPPDTEDDEAMARRLQEEMYGGAGSGSAGVEDVRAPMQRTTETLVGPDANWGPAEGDDLDSMVQEQLARRRAGGYRPAAENLNTN